MVSFVHFDQASAQRRDRSRPGKKYQKIWPVVYAFRAMQVRQISKKTFRVGGPQSPFSISSFFILFFTLYYFLSFSNKKSILPVSHRLLASTIIVRGEPERVNLIVRALEPDYLLLDIFLHLQSEPWTQWTIEAARVKVHHRPYSFEDGSVVYPANTFDSRPRGD